MKKENKIIKIHHDCDGVMRSFYSYALDLFFNLYPEYKQHQVPINEVRGWRFADEFMPLKIAEEVDKKMTELFFGGKLTYEVFRNAPALVTPEKWDIHVSMLRKEIPNCRIVISTHQYTSESKVATIKWLNEYEYDDLIFTDKKDNFDADFLLDDRPQTIEEIYNSSSKCTGILFKNERSNGWYRKKGKSDLLIVDSIEFYRKVILFSIIYKKHLKQVYF